MDQQNAVKIKLEGDASGLKAAIAEAMQILDNLKQNAGNIGVGPASVSGQLSSTPGTFQVSHSVRPTRTSAPRGGGGPSVASGPAFHTPMDNFFARGYWNYMQSGGTAGYQTWMGAQPAMSMAQAGGVVNPTMQMTAGMMPTQVIPAQPPTPWWQNPASYAGRAFRGSVFGGLQGVNDYINWQTQATLTGRPDALSGYQSAGQFIGGISGALIGSLPVFGPFGPYIGAGVGSQVGGSILENLFAPGIKAERMLSDALPTAGLAAGMRVGGGGNRIFIGMRGDYNTSEAGLWGNKMGITPVNVAGGYAGGAVNFVDGAAQLVKRIRDQFGGKVEMAPSQDEVLKSGAALISSIFQGGINPFAVAGNSPGYRAPIDPETAAKFREIANGKGGGMMDPWVRAVATAGAAAYGDFPAPHRGSPESVYMRLQRRAYERYGRSGNEVLKSLDPIYASLPETGSNLADISLKFGAESAYRFSLMSVEKDEADPVSLETLYTSSADYRRGVRSAAMAGTRAMGVGGAQERAYQSQMNALGRIPNGDTSLAYNEALSRRRSATLRKYSEEDILNYDIPSVRLQGERERANYLPFSPGNIFGMELRSIGLNEKQLATVSARYNSLKGRGDLSEEQQLQFESTMQSLQTSIARSYGTLSEGFENRLPAMSAGRPSFGSRWNSLQGAAFNMQFIGSPIRAYGATNGSQLQSQNDFVNAYAVQGDVGPYSRTQVMNNQPVVGLLQRIADSLDQMKAGGGRGRMSENLNFGAAMGGVMGNLNTNQPGAN